MITGFDQDNVLYLLQKVKFPAEKWRSLANGLRLASAVPMIEADQRDVVSKLQALIARWVKNTTQPNQWITLVEAIVERPSNFVDLLTDFNCYISIVLWFIARLLPPSRERSVKNYLSYPRKHNPNWK